MNKKIFVFGVIVLFLGLAIAPSINANVNILSKLSLHIIEEQYDTKKLTCRYYTLNGVEEIEKEIFTKDAEYLYHIMDGSDSNIVASELSRLCLLPDSIDIEEAKDLISGEYGQRQVEKYRKHLSNNPFFRLFSSDVKRNFFCYVNGSSRDGYNSPFIVKLLYGLAFPILAIIVALYFLLHLIPSKLVVEILKYLDALALLIIMGVLTLVEYFYYNFPIALNLLCFGDLENSDSRLNTLGMLGKWQLTDIPIVVIMVGFFGIWINIFDEYHSPCKFKGFCFYLKAYPIGKCNINQQSLSVASPLTNMQDRLISRLSSVLLVGEGDMNE